MKGVFYLDTNIEAKRSERRRMMLEESVFKVVPIVALPMVISMLIDSFYNLADTYFVSQLGTAATAAVGINNSLMFFIRALGMGFGMGAASYISRLLGAKRGDEASRVASTAVITSIVFVSAAAVIAFAFRGPLVTLLGATATSKQYSIDYATYILLAAPFTAGEIGLSQTLRAEGSTTYSMIGMLSGCFVNLALDPLFIFAFKWGVAGAAAATALSKVVTFTVLLIPFLRGKSLLRISPKLFTPRKDIYVEIARMGIPTFLRACLMSVASVVTNNYAGSYNDSVLAAVSISNRIMMFVGSMVMGFGQGFQPIAGYCYGAKRYKRVRTAFWATTGFGFAICLTLGTALYILAPQAVGIFTVTDSEIVRIGAYMVRVQCLTLPAHVWGMIINGVFQGLGKPVGAMILGLSRQVICLIPSMIILNVMFGVEGLMNAQAISDCLTMLIAVPLLINILNFLKKREKEDPQGDEEETTEPEAILEPFEN
jgi:putative MATE family efflux protein